MFLCLQSNHVQLEVYYLPEIVLSELNEIHIPKYSLHNIYMELHIQKYIVQEFIVIFRIFNTKTQALFA